jgi:hypothetical protein
MARQSMPLESSLGYPIFGTAFRSLISHIAIDVVRTIIVLVCRTLRLPFAHEQMAVNVDRSGTTITRCHIGLGRMSFYDHLIFMRDELQM